MPSPLKENNFGVTIILIPHNNSERFKTRMQRDLLPTIQAHSSWKFQMIFIDNSDADKRFDYDLPGQENIEHCSIWSDTNVMYGPAMNIAIKRARYEFLIYVCSNHGHMYDPTWIDDLINPMIQNSSIAMAGSIYPSCNPEDMGFSSQLPKIHIQGGLFAAKTQALLANPYTSDPRWIHWGSDIYQCFQLMSVGYKLANVDTVKSVWRQNLNSPEKWKFVHDYSE